MLKGKYFLWIKFDDKLVLQQFPNAVIWIQRWTYRWHQMTRLSKLCILSKLSSNNQQVPGEWEGGGGYWAQGAHTLSTTQKCTLTNLKHLMLLDMWFYRFIRRSLTSAALHPSQIILDHKHISTKWQKKKRRHIYVFPFVTPTQVMNRVGKLLILMSLEPKFEQNSSQLVPEGNNYTQQ